MGIGARLKGGDRMSKISFNAAANAYFFTKNIPKFSSWGCRLWRINADTNIRSFKKIDKKYIIGHLSQFNTTIMEAIVILQYSFYLKRIKYYE